MRLPWSKILAAAKALYTIFLKGKTVKLPGGGSVVLPQKGKGP